MNEFLGVGVFLLITGLIIYLLYQDDQKKRQNKLKRRQILQRSESDYRNGLTSLKKTPNDADLKERVLRLGREYSGYTRKFQ